MNSLFRYELLLKTALSLFLFGQIWVGVVEYYNQIVEKETIFIESKNLEDSQPVDEDNKEKKDDNIRDRYNTVSEFICDFKKHGYHFLMFTSPPFLKMSLKPPEALV